MYFIEVTDDETLKKIVVNLSQIVTITDAGQYRTINFKQGSITVLEPLTWIKKAIDYSNDRNRSSFYIQPYEVNDETSI